MPAPGTRGCWGSRNTAPAPAGLQLWGWGVEGGNDPWESCPKCLGPQEHLPGYGWVPPPHPPPRILSPARSRSRVSLIKGRWSDLNTRAGPRAVEQWWRGRRDVLGTNHSVPPTGMGLAGSDAFPPLLEPTCNGGWQRGVLGSTRGCAPAVSPLRGHSESLQPSPSPSRL